MADEDKRISELTNITVLTPADLFPVVSQISGDTENVSLEQLTANIKINISLFEEGTDPGSVQQITEYVTTSATGSDASALSGGSASGSSASAQSGGASDGQRSHADSSGNALGNDSHADSQGTATANGSHADSQGSVTGGSGASHADSQGIVDGDYSHADSQGHVYEDSGASHADSQGKTRAFAGHADSGGEVKIGSDYSHADSYGDTTGQYAHADSQGHANGNNSHADSQGTADGDASHADSQGTASGSGGHGDSGGDANGESSHADSGGTANAAFSHASSGGTVEGEFSSADSGGYVSSGTNSHADSGGIVADDNAHADSGGNANAMNSNANSGGTTIDGHSFSSASNGVYSKEDYTHHVEKLNINTVKTTTPIKTLAVDVDGFVTTSDAASVGYVDYAIELKGLVNHGNWLNTSGTSYSKNIIIDSYNIVAWETSDGSMEIFLPSPVTNKSIIIHPRCLASVAVDIYIAGVYFGGSDNDYGTVYITRRDQVVHLLANGYGWHVVSHSNKTDNQTAILLDNISKKGTNAQRLVYATPVEGMVWEELDGSGILVASYKYKNGVWRPATQPTIAGKSTIPRCDIIAAQVPAAGTIYHETILVENDILITKLGIFVAALNATDTWYLDVFRASDRARICGGTITPSTANSIISCTVSATQLSANTEYIFSVRSVNGTGSFGYRAGYASSSTRLSGVVTGVTGATPSTLAAGTNGSVCAYIEYSTN